MPKKTLMRDYDGRQVKALKPLGNSLGKMPVGALFTVRSYSNRGLDLVAEPCPCCGIRLNILHVPRESVELI